MNMKQASLPNDALQEILYKLPLKSIVRFKSVSKQWNSLLSHPQFIRTFYRLTGDQLLVIDSKTWNLFNVKYHDIINNNCEVEDNKSENPLYSPNNIIETKIVGCFNGLVAILLISEYDDPCLMLWNPLTKERIVVTPNDLHLFKCCTVFGHTKSWFKPYDVYGMCYDSSDDEYWVVLVSNYQSPPSSPTSFSARGCVPEYATFNACVVSLKTGASTALQDDAFGNLILGVKNRGIGMVVCGVPHWLIHVPVSWQGLSTREEIFYFDREKGVFCKMARPPPHQDEDCLLGLGALDGQRQLGVVCQNNTSSDFEVWVMKEYGEAESWTHMWSISTSTLQISYESIKFVHLLGTMPKGKLLINVCYVDPSSRHHRKQDLWVCDGVCDDLTLINKHHSWFEIFAYEPTLISPQQIIGS